MKLYLYLDTHRKTSLEYNIMSQLGVQPSSLSLSEAKSGYI